MIPTANGSRSQHLTTAMESTRASFSGLDRIILATGGAVVENAAGSPVGKLVSATIWRSLDGCRLAISLPSRTFAGLGFLLSLALALPLRFDIRTRRQLGDPGRSVVSDGFGNRSVPGKWKGQKEEGHLNVVAQPGQ